MATQYPEGIDNATTLPKIIDLVSPVNAVSVNLLRDAIVAIETELGIEPSSGYANVRDRLDALTLLVETSGSGVQSIKQDGISIVSPATSINFIGAVSVTDAGDCEATVEILSSGGTITGASNIGSGADIFSADIGNVLQFRGISGTNDVSTIVNGNNVEVSGAALLPLDGDRPMTGDLDLGNNNITNVVLINSVDITDHHVRHENGGADEISVDNLSGELADPQKVSVRVNSGTVIGSRKRLNFIPSSDISISAIDDGSEIDISFDLETSTVSTLMYQEIFSALSGQTNFVLTQTPVGQQYVEMFINGVSQTVGSSYDYILIGKTVVYIGSVVLEGGEEVVIKYFRKADVDGIVATQMYQESFVATPSQTEFVVSHLPISQEYVEMFIDGLSKTEGVDYTADGYVITYSNLPPLSGGEIIDIKYFTSLYADDIKHEIISLIETGQIDGYNLIINYTPANYPETENTFLGEHLSNIDFAIGNHGSNHENGGTDEISVNGLSGVLSDPQNIVAAYNGTNVGTRPILNFIPGANVGITVADNTTGSRADITIAASVTAAPSVAISAGTNSTNAGTVVFSNSNGISFGMDTAGIVTASYGQIPSWISAGTNSRSSGTVQFSNSNGVSFGMDTAGIITASISSNNGGIALSAGTNSRSIGTVTLASVGNNVSVGMDTNGLVTFSVVSVSPQVPLWVSAGTNSTSAGTIVFSNSNGISFGMNTLGEITASTTQASQVPTWIVAGTNSRSSGTVSFINSNGVSFGMNTSGGITASISAAAGNSLAISAGTNSKNSGTIVFSNSNGISFGMGSDGIVTASTSANFVPYIIVGENLSNIISPYIPNFNEYTGLHFYISSPASVNRNIAVYKYGNIGSSFVFHRVLTQNGGSGPLSWSSSNSCYSIYSIDDCCALYSKTVKSVTVSEYSDTYYRVLSTSNYTIAAWYYSLHASYNKTRTGSFTNNQASYTANYTISSHLIINNTTGQSYTESFSWTIETHYTKFSIQSNLSSFGTLSTSLGSSTTKNIGSGYLNFQNNTINYTFQPGEYLVCFGFNAPKTTNFSTLSNLIYSSSDFNFTDILRLSVITTNVHFSNIWMSSNFPSQYFSNNLISWTNISVVQYNTLYGRVVGNFSQLTNSVISTLLNHVTYASLLLPNIKIF